MPGLSQGLQPPVRSLTLVTTRATSISRVGQAQAAVRPPPEEEEGGGSAPSRARALRREAACAAMARTPPHARIAPPPQRCLFSSARWAECDATREGGGGRSWIEHTDGWDTVNDWTLPNIFHRHLSALATVHHHPTQLENHLGVPVLESASRKLCSSTCISDKRGIYWGSGQTTNRV